MLGNLVTALWENAIKLARSQGSIRENLVRENCLLLTSRLGQNQCLVV